MPTLGTNWTIIVTSSTFLRSKASATAPGEQAENYERKRLEKSGQPQFEGRAGQLVDLIEVRDIADLDGQRCQDAGHPEQPKIADEQGRPRPNNLALSRVLVYFGAVIQSVRKAKLG